MESTVIKVIFNVVLLTRTQHAQKRRGPKYWKTQEFNMC